MTGTPTNFLKTLNALFTALLGGQLFFVAASAFVVFQDTYLTTLDISDQFSVILGVMVIAFILISSVSAEIVFRKKTEEAKRSSTLAGKLAGYRTAFIIKAAMFEAPVVFSLVAVIATRTILFYIPAIVMLLFFITIRPTREKVINDLSLDHKEQMELE